MREILVAPDPRLRQICQPIKAIDSAIKALVADMERCLKGAECLEGVVGMGLAAPQLGELLQAFVINMQGLHIILFNARVIKASGEHTILEGCLSLPGQLYLVRRPKIVKVRGIDIHEQERSIKGHDILAQVLMHELEHCQGILIEDIAQGRVE